MLYSVSPHIGSYTASSLNSGVESNSKIEVPVQSGVSVYAQFKYVRGVPASSNQESVSLSKAKIIDNMVSFLNKNGPDEYLNKNEEYTLDELETEVHKVVNDKKSNFNTLPGRGIDTGVIFNITA